MIYPHIAIVACTCLVLIAAPSSSSQVEATPGQKSPEISHDQASSDSSVQSSPTPTMVDSIRTASDTTCEDDSDSPTNSYDPIPAPQRNTGFIQNDSNFQESFHDSSSDSSDSIRMSRDEVDAGNTTPITSRIPGIGVGRLLRWRRRPSDSPSRSQPSSAAIASGSTLRDSESSSMTGALEGPASPAISWPRRLRRHRRYENQEASSSEPRHSDIERRNVSGETRLNVAIIRHDLGIDELD